MRIVWLVGMAAAGLGAGCGSSSDARRLAELCEETSNLGAELCACVAEQAESELSAEALALLLALMEERQDRVEELRGRLTLEDATKAGTFMVRAPATCAMRQRGLQPRTGGSP